MPRICFAIAFSSLLLAACGGGGGDGNGGGMPPPPPPPNNTNDALTNLTVDETFALASATHAFSNTIANVTYSIAGLGAGETVFYDQSADSFRFNVSQGGVTFNTTFSPGELTGFDAATGFETFEDGADTLAIYRPGAAPLNLDYVTFGFWGDATGESRDVEIGHFAFGIRTETGEMPNTGNATFTGVTTGTLTRNSTLFAVTADGTVTANFGTGTVTGNFPNAQLNDTNGLPAGAWRSIEFNANINGNSFNGAAGTVDNVLNGTVQGGFFGPANSAPTEVGGVWRLTGGGETAVGAFVGQE